jgi:hypothetical protein
MPKHTSSNCILVIESPWELDGQDSNRSSVVPFIEGIAKLHGDTDVYFLNFYDKSSFKTALDCLCKQLLRIPSSMLPPMAAQHTSQKCR